ncbi:MAG: hypothetical protein JOZ41_07610, partial [Chloroflexi bacterium]|nr:hypothetical protein [Chloroflexota bacterium]
WWQDLQADYGQYPVPTGGSTPGPTQDQFARAQADMAKLHRLINNHRRRTGLEWDVVRDAIRYGVDPNVSGPATWAVSRLFGALYYLDVASSDEYHQTNTGLDDYHTAQTFMSNTWDALKQLPCQATSSTAPTATQQQINEIRGGQHGPLPPAQPSGSCSGSGNVVSMTVLNKTPYRLSLWIAGPTERSLTIDPGASTSLQLPPGSYEVAGKVPSTNVLPFYGTWNLGSGCSYEDDFYVQ